MLLQECGVTGRKFTHEQVFQLSRGFAAALIQSGFKRGDVIGIVLQNVPEFPIVLFGIWEAGLIASPINPAYTAGKISKTYINRTLRVSSKSLKQNAQSPVVFA